MSDQRLITEAAILKRLKQSHDQSRTEIRSAMRPGDRRTVWHGDVQIGDVRVNAATKGYAVTDRPAFLRWVQEHYPDAVIAVPTVVDAWEKDFLKHPITEDGEIADGVEHKISNPPLTVTANDAALDLADKIIGTTLGEISDGRDT